MATQSREDRIREKIERKMADVSRKMADLQENHDLQEALGALTAEMNQVEAELNRLANLGGEGEPGLRERLEARRERLMARQERLELKLDLRKDMYDRLRESMDEMQESLQESLARMQEEVKDRVAHTYNWRQQPAPPPPPSAAAERRMQEERRKILEMVQQGTINAEDAAQLLDALRDQEDNARRRRRPRWVRIRVTDVNADKVRVNLTLPVGLVRAGLRAGGSIAGVEGLDTAGLEEMLDRGEIGHLLDVQDAAGGERVEIFVE